MALTRGKWHGLFVVASLICKTAFSAEGNDMNNGQNGAIVLENKYQIVRGRGVGWLDCNSDGTELLVSSGKFVQLLETANLTKFRELPITADRAIFTAEDKLIVCGIPPVLGQEHLAGIRVIRADTEEVLVDMRGRSTFRVDKKRNLLAHPEKREVCVLYDLLKDVAVHHWRVRGASAVAIYNISASGIVGIDTGLAKPAALLWHPPYDKDPVGFDIPGGVSELHVSPDDRVLAIGNESNEVQLWDVEKKTRIQTLAKHSGERGKVCGLLFSPNGRYLVSVNNREELIAWDTSGYKEIARLPPQPGVSCALAWFPDSRRFATGGSTDGVVKVWRIRDEKAPAR